jgi:putative NADH-flavin reductase
MWNRRLFLSVALMAAASGMAIGQDKAAHPLKIVVYGGGGNIGSRIVAEAAARGHQVTVVDRNPKDGSTPPGVKLVKGDVFDTGDVAKMIAGQDVVITAVAVRPTPTRDFYVRMVKSVVAAQRYVPGVKPRFYIVGGASSLEVAPGKRLVDTLPPTLPDGVKNEILSMVDALDYMRTVDDVPWTFFSPPQNIAAGARTGKFRIGGDQLLKDANGDSRISYEDYAVAMLNEIEKPKYLNKRFTVAY